MQPGPMMRRLRQRADVRRFGPSIASQQALSASERFFHTTPT